MTPPNCTEATLQTQGLYSGNAESTHYMLFNLGVANT